MQTGLKLCHVSNSANSYDALNGRVNKMWPLHYVLQVSIAQTVIKTRLGVKICNSEPRAAVGFIVVFMIITINRISINVREKEVPEKTNPPTVRYLQGHFSNTRQKVDLG
jgi:hypothetical protein